jgi:hypothetical protein
MSHFEEPIIPSDPAPLPPRDANAARGRRRRVTRRDSIPHDAVGQAAFIFDLSRRAYPSFELFVFSLACGAILGLGYLLDSQAALLLGVLVAPLMIPWVGFLLAILTGSPRFLFETFMALFISAAIVFLCGLLTGFASRLLPQAALYQVYNHSRLWLPELVVIAIGAITLVASFARSENKPFLPSVVIAYTFYLPVSAGGFGLGSGLGGIFPQGVYVFAVHFLLASILGLLTLFILKLRPSPRGYYFSVAALALFGWLFVNLAVPNFPLKKEADAVPPPAITATQLSALPSSTPSLPAKTTNTPALSKTPVIASATAATQTPAVTLPPTDTPTITMTVEPAPVFGKVSANEGGGANLRETPGGKIVKTLGNGTIVEVRPEFQIVNGITWIHVFAAFNGERLEGWLLESTLIYATPAPDFEITLTPTP